LIGLSFLSSLFNLAGCLFKGSVVIFILEGCSLNSLGAVYFGSVERLELGYNGSIFGLKIINRVDIRLMDTHVKT